MFAVIKTGGKQYRVAGGDEFTIERVAGAAGDTVRFAEVLMVGTSIGAPFVAGATVTAEIVDQVRGPKVISFKKRRRQNSKRTRGHRQDLTLVRISEILTDGAEPTAKAASASAQTTGEAAAAEKPKRAKKADTPAETASAPVETAGTPDEITPKKPRTTRKKSETSEEA